MLKNKNFWRIILGIYLIIVLYETILSRPLGSYSDYHLELFYSYRLAYTFHSNFEWQCIILNYLMFIPFGFAIPICFSKLSKWNRTYLVGFLLSLMIELTQFVLHVGIFEVDDIFGNVIGCIIGYGIFSLLKGLYHKQKYDQDLSKATIILQIPLMVMLTTFIVLKIKSAF